jgi:pimeloyl-ACP methyl ester carboxylesterase
MQNYSDYWYKSRDGLNLYARDYPCRNHREQPWATIVCIPGLTRNSADFALLSEHLSNRFRVIAVDLRGRGRSDYDSCPQNYQPGVYAEDMIGLLDSLELDKVILIGTSLGGLVSILLSSMQSQRISSVILNDIGPEAHQPGLDRIKSYVRNRSTVRNWDEAMVATRETLATEYPNFGPADWMSFTRNIYREDSQGKPVLNYDPAISLPLESGADESLRGALWPVFAKMSPIPTLLIRGQLSDILTRESVEKMLSLHSRLQFTEVGECGHAPTLAEQESLLAIDCFLNPRASGTLGQPGPD